MQADLAYMGHSLADAVSSTITLSDEACERLEAIEAHCCPNCEGSITHGEHSAFGICYACHNGMVRYA